MDNIFAVIAAVIIVVLIILFYPLLIIWCVNVLFDAGADYGAKTWLATLILLLALRAAAAE